MIEKTIHNNPDCFVNVHSVPARKNIVNPKLYGYMKQKLIIEMDVEYTRKVRLLKIDMCTSCLTEKELNTYMARIIREAFGGNHAKNGIS